MKKFFSSIIFITTIIALAFTKTIENDSPHLIIHMDVNQTVIAIDTIQNKHFTECVVSALAKRYFAKWDDTIDQPISYYDYIYQHKYPKNSSNQYSDAERELAFKELASVARYAAPSLYENIQFDTHHTLEKYKNQPFVIFPSFFKLIEFLESHNFKYTIVFRTFGQDLPLISQDIENKLQQPLALGKFKEGTFYMDGKGYQDPSAIHTLLKKHKFVGIEEDYRYWAEHDELREFGKIFPVINTLNEKCVFFDDHIPSHDNAKGAIIHPVDLNNKPLALSELINNKLLVKVDMIDAILDDEYFIKHLNNMLNSAQK